MECSVHFCLLIFIFVNVRAFPTDQKESNRFLTKVPSITEDFGRNRVKTSTSSKNHQRNNASSLMTTSSLLFKDTKPILTYLLGQPKKQGSLSSPGSLLAPDRYEFFTFDDDGQIVKKLMSVKEIQKIIANTEKTFTGEHGTPIEYYQILSVTPDVESIPSVSRINPNEPLFSIHDVIASVQNVLKSEMNIKQSQLDNTKSSGPLKSEHYEIVTDDLDPSYVRGSQKPSSVLASDSSFLKKIQSGSTESNADVPVTTTRLSEQQITNGLLSNSYIPTESRESVKTADLETLKETDAEVTSYPDQPQNPTTLTKTSKPTTTLSAPVPTFVLTQEQTQPSLSKEDATTSKTDPVVSSGEGESNSQTQADADPILIPNDTYLEVEPFTYKQNWRIEESDSAETHSTISPSAAETFAKINALLTETEPVLDVEPATKKPEVEISTVSEQFSITPDLANSVSSVLWQIASENALLDNAGKSTEIPLPQSTKFEASEIIETSETKADGHQVPSSSTSTEINIDQSDELFEKAEENPLTVLESILRTQNPPSAFQRVTSNVEKATESEPETHYELISTTSSLPEKTFDFVLKTTTEDKVLEPDWTTLSLLREIQNKTLIESKDATLTTENSEAFSSVAEEKNNKEETTTTVWPSGPFSNFSSNSGFLNEEQLKFDLNDNRILTRISTREPRPNVTDTEALEKTKETLVLETTEFSNDFANQKTKTSDSEAVNREVLTEPVEDYSTVTQTSDVTKLPTTFSDDPKSKEVLSESVSTATTQKFSTPAAVESNSDDSQKENPAEVDITYVPMLITNPVESKEENVPSEGKVDKVEVREGEEDDGVDLRPLTVASTETEDDDLESKKLPDFEPDLPETLPVTTAVINHENKIVSHSSDSKVEEEIGTFKQSVPIKHGSGKPQISGYGSKPTRVKPQQDSKPFKTSLPSFFAKPSSSSPKPFASSSASKPSGFKEPVKNSENKRPYENHLQSSPSLLELDAAPPENLGLESSVTNLNEDIKRFSELCNELAFSLWSSVTHNGLSFVRSLVVSPFAVTSLLAMVFLGARGPTSGQMNDVLKLDDMVTFNPHLVFRNVTESLVISRNPGVATAAFVRELYSDRSKGKLLDFYKERAQQFYDGHVEEINFKTIGDTIRKQTNHLVKRQTWGKTTDFLRSSNLVPKPPLAAFGANIFQTDCSKASIKDRDGEMYFVILPASRLRRLVPIPAAVWRSDFLAGYEPQLDATAVSLGPPNSAVSTIFVLPGQQGLIAPGDTLARLEHHLLGSPYRKGHWTRLMKSLLPRPGLELQIPRMSHKSVINVTSSLQRMGLKDLFSADKADLTGLNGLANDLHLSDMLQVNLFSTCGDEPIGSRHHSEVYPAVPILRREKSSDGLSSDSIDNLFAVSDFEDPAISALPLELRPRQARIPLSKPGAKIPEPPRLRFDRPFLFFVRHNPTGLILHMGRFNPRLTP